MIKFPYGISDFYKIITEGYLYIDRTDRIPLLEELGSQLLFLRPRRFGKSLLLSTLENYYDVAKADEFERLFGSLAIGSLPTELHSQYVVLSWDFSAVSPQGSAEEIQQALHRYLNARIRDFGVRYRDLLPGVPDIEPVDALVSFQSLLTLVQQSPCRLYLLIDEYDNFANEVLMGSLAEGQQRYEALLYGEGTLKTVFKAVKSAMSGRGLDRLFMTGVSPLVLSDMSSGFNVAKNISLSPSFNDLCGFEEHEVLEMLQQFVNEGDVSEARQAEALDLMRTFYNGYSFSYDASNVIYNPTLTLYFLEEFQRSNSYPRNMLDSNLAMDRGKLKYISALPHGKDVVQEALGEKGALSLEDFSESFGVEEVFKAPKDSSFMLSFLYYFGVLTLGGSSPLGEFLLRIPNLVVKRLYVEQLQAVFLPDVDRDDAFQAAKSFYRNGDPQALCDFIEQRYFKVFDNRDYRWSNELTIKTAFLTILFHDTFYIMDSEPELERGYADLLMLVRPDMRQYELLDLLLEFKYLSLPELGLSGKQAREMAYEELGSLPKVAKKLSEGKTALKAYRKSLETRYGKKLRLRTYIVVALGFERLVWEEC